MKDASSTSAATTTLSLHHLADLAQIVGGFATAAAALIALVAILIAAVQIVYSRRQAREAEAMAAHRELMKLCFEHPEFSSESMYKSHFGKASLSKQSLDDGSIESERYQWFLSILLSTCEKILTSVCPDTAWEAVIDLQLSYHRTALASLWPQWGPYYGTDLGSRIEWLGATTTSAQSKKNVRSSPPRPTGKPARPERRVNKR